MAPPDDSENPFPFLRRLKAPGKSTIPPRDPPTPPPVVHEFDEDVDDEPSADEQILRPRIPGGAAVAVASVAVPTPPSDDEDSGARSLPRHAALAAQYKLDKVRFHPEAPATLEDAGLSSGEVESLVIKFLLGAPGSNGREVSHALGLPDRLVRDLLAGLKNRKVAFHKKASTMGDFEFELSEDGRALAHDMNRVSRYAGRAPVTMDRYVESIKLQSVTMEQPKLAELKEAFSDLIVRDEMIQHLGPAITAGKGCFFFGPPGNGKTSIAERITRAYGSPVYVPFAIKFGGQIIKVFDPAVHEPVDRRIARAAAGARRMDHRWVLCKRPTIVVGGELTMDELELNYDEWSGTCEAPIQMKANSGTLVIDDLGRQAMPPNALLNRWIVPMEKRIDYLTVPGGRKMEVPFDPMLVFSTNLEPRSLVDDAFLRRIPYKVHIGDPDEGLFRTLWDKLATELGLEYTPDVLDHLIAEHFVKTGRSMRNCHPRDLLLQVKNICIFREIPGKVTREMLDEAVALYFSVV